MLFFYIQLIADTLRKIESNVFSDMRKIQRQLEELHKNRLTDELKKEISEHQRVLMELQEEYGRFSFLLKLIVRMNSSVCRYMYISLCDMPITNLGIF